jgi:hypothetical protein
VLDINIHNNEKKNTFMSEMRNTTIVLLYRSQNLIAYKIRLGFRREKFLMHFSTRASSFHAHFCYIRWGVSAIAPKDILKMKFSFPFHRKRTFFISHVTGKCITVFFFFIFCSHTFTHTHVFMRYTYKHKILCVHICWANDGNGIIVKLSFSSKVMTVCWVIWWSIHFLLRECHQHSMATAWIF